MNRFRSSSDDPRPQAGGSRPAIGLLLLLGGVLLLAGCGTSDPMVFVYPGEEIDFQQADMKTPTLYIDTVTDMRPPLQRAGQGSFLDITYPSDEAWGRPATEIYAEALAQDVEQTHLVELVPLRGQADFVLSVDLLSMGCRFQRSGSSFLIPFVLGMGLGMAAGEDGSDRLKLGTVLGGVAVMAVPMPSKNRSEAEVRLTLRDRTGNILWRKSCLGEVEEKVYVAATSRHDQKLMQQSLPKAVKRCNACLVGQLRQALLENAGP